MLCFKEDGLPSARLDFKSNLQHNKGVIKIRGRVDEAIVSYETKHITLLPSDHWIFLLITSHAHQHSHSDVAATTVKTKFWILKGSKQSKSIKYKCGFCCTHCIAPYNVKIARNNTAKHYGVSLTCLNTAAVHSEMAVNISGILQIIQRFFAL